MYINFLVDEWDLNMVIGRYFDRSRLDSEDAQEGLTILQLYLELAVQENFFPQALEMDVAAEEIGIPRSELRSKLTALIREGWRPPVELEQMCVYAYYPLVQGGLPSLDTMLAVMLTAMLIDAAQAAKDDDIEAEFVRGWLRRKVEPLQVQKMSDFHVVMFLVDYLVDDLKGMSMTFKRYRDTYGGARVTSKVLGEFFEKCSWIQETRHVTFRTEEPGMSPVQILYQLREEIRLDFKRECLALGIFE